MSLATRCTSCGTIFKVVQDQLKVSEGWVRCGRCNEVFNALDGLFDLERDPPPQRPSTAAPRVPVPADASDRLTQPPSNRQPEAPPEQPAPSPQSAPPDRPSTVRAPPPQSSAAPSPTGIEDVPATHEDDALDSRWLLRSSSDGRSASERRSKQVRQSDFADAQFPKDAAFDLDDDSDFPLDPEPHVQPLQPRPMPAIKGTGKGGLKKPPQAKAKGKSAAGTPSFVRRANRQAQWRHPAVRATLAFVALALLGLLLLQTGIAFRDQLATQAPETGPYLTQLCSFAGCEIAPWRHIEDLSVDSVSLVRSAPVATDSDPVNSVATEAIYKLNVVLHNRASVAIATPHIELSLTDAAGNLVSKRVLSPAEFGFTSSDLAASSNTSLQTRLASTGGHIVGYTVELFYP